MKHVPMVFKDTVQIKCCFYSYIRSKKKVKDYIEYLIKPDGTKTNNHAESAEVLIQFLTVCILRKM